VQKSRLGGRWRPTMLLCASWTRRASWACSPPDGCMMAFSWPFSPPGGGDGSWGSGSGSGLGSGAGSGSGSGSGPSSYSDTGSASGGWRWATGRCLGVARCPRLGGIRCGTTAPHGVHTCTWYVICASRFWLLICTNELRIWANLGKKGLRREGAQWRRRIRVRVVATVL
jgi:hypothetical protein